MDLSVRLDLSDSVVAVGGAVDLQLGAGLMAWHPLPRSSVHRSGLLLLRRRRLQDLSRTGKVATNKPRSRYRCWTEISERTESSDRTRLASQRRNFQRILS